MWSEYVFVQVIVYWMFYYLWKEGWFVDLLEMFYLDEDILVWVKEGLFDENVVVYVDNNGNVLEVGDIVVLIQDLKVKGVNFMVKCGIVVCWILLVYDNFEYIEGKVDGQQIVIFIKYVKKLKQCFG